MAELALPTIQTKSIKEQLIKTSPYEWELPVTVRNGMNAKGKIIASDKMLKAIEEQAIQQLTNVAMLPGVVGEVMAMPDAHWGYGLPMGSVAAFDAKKGIISSGLCGFDINCGINLVRTNLTYDDIKDKMPELIEKLYKKVPVGVGGRAGVILNDKQLDDVLKNGAAWCVKNGYGTKEDLKHTEENGCMKGADPKKVSDLAKKRGRNQLGTLGAGNHFLEIQQIGEIHDSKFAKKCGITKKGQICIMIHSGSRGLGHQVATDYLQIQEKAIEKYNIQVPDKQLACAPASSVEGKDYFSAMKCAANFSFANRLVMTHWIREVFQEVFQKDWKKMDISTIYGLCHNIVKLEEFVIDGKKKKVFVHRKGATRAYPEQPVIIAGSMGTSSYLLKGTKLAMTKSFGSSAHGAGRALSRNEALKRFNGQKVQSDLAKINIISKAPNMQSLAEEAPDAYKDIETVIDSVHGAGISLRVAKLLPLGVIKG